MICSEGRGTFGGSKEFINYSRGGDYSGSDAADSSSDELNDLRDLEVSHSPDICSFFTF